MSRKLQALRNLAERPGTAAEGAVARAMLAKLEGKKRVRSNSFGVEGEKWDAFERFLRTGSMEDLHTACAR